MVVWAFAWSFPWRLRPPAPELQDWAYTPYAHRFFAEGRPWGTDTLHTSGVWGFLRFPHYDADTFSMFALCHLFLASLIGWYFATTGAQLARHRWMYWGTAFALIPLLGMSDDARWYVPIFALLAWRSRGLSTRAHVPLVAGLALATALALHAKGNFLIATVLLMVGLLVCDFLQRRTPWPVVLVTFFAIVLLFVGGGDLLGFGRHVLHVFESVSAYSVVFSSGHALLMPALFLLAVVFASVARCLAVEQRWQWPLAVVYALLLFFLYKGAVVRQDPIHVARALTAFVLFVATEAVARLGAQESGAPAWRLRAGLGLDVLALCFVLLPLSEKDVRDRLKNDACSQVLELIASLTAPGEARELANEAGLAEVRRAVPLPEVDGSIAVVGTYQVPLLAHGLKPETIPVIAHYEVWSPRSAAMIDQYFESPLAPEFVLRTSNYESVSNELTLARHYDRFSAGKHHVMLKRRKDPLSVSWNTVIECDVGWDEPIAIPPEHRDSLLIAEVELESNALGRLVGFLLHPAHIQMVLSKPKKRSSRVRINPVLAREGVVVAGGGRSWDATAAALHGTRHGLLSEVESRVKAITFRGRIAGRDAAALFKPRIHVTIRAATFHGHPTEALP